MARGLKFRIQEVEGLCYLFSENKGTDQLCGYCTADLRLCFSHKQKSDILKMQLKYERILMAMGSQREQYACNYSINIGNTPSTIVNSSASLIYHHIHINN